MDKNDELYVESTVASVTDKPYVLISWGSESGMLSISDARARGLALIQAAAIAEAEAAVFQKLRPPKSPGFGKATKDQQVYAQMLQLVRSGRPPLPPEIEPIFGFATQQPLINYQVGDRKGQLYCDDARHHAQGLLEAAESAERDGFFYAFFSRRHEILSRSQAEELLQELKLFRQQNKLEDLFAIDQNS